MQVDKKIITNPTKAKGILTGPSQSRRRRVWSGSYKQTQKLGKDLALRLASLAQGKHAVVFALYGNLGAGKTTFLQGLAKGLGIKEKILSPTFVIIKHFKFQISNFKFTDFYHVDCYRLENSEDILDLQFKEIIKNPCNIVAIEWPEKIKKVLPKSAIIIKFKFIDKNKREINFKM